jgi:hypothetical protein
MDPLTTLETRVEALGNHYRKYLEVIRRNGGDLLSALEADGSLMQVHLWGSSSSPEEDMRVVTGLVGDVPTRIRRLSCYYAAQYLFMHLRHLDILSLERTSGDPLQGAYLRFMRDIGNDFRQLTKGYMENVLELYLAEAERPEFFICSVGTRADQDDIDVGIITSGRGDDSALNRAIQRLTQHMLVYATPLHLYLSEHVGSELYTSTIAEYDDFLERQIGDVVILSELVNAKRILGSERLFERFQREIIARYFHGTGWDGRYHEGFLRGIMGEARALLVSPLQSDSVAPKEDALRIIKHLLYAKKARYALPEVNAWDIMAALSAREPRLVLQYEQLYKSTSFLEMFKFLLQMYVAQEDLFRLEEIDPGQRTRIAEQMGYGSIGKVGAWEQLVIDYYRHVNESRSICEYLLRDLTGHLSAVSIFTGMFRAQAATGPDGEARGVLARDFIHTARFFTGTRYWEDVLHRLETDHALLDDFIGSFERMSRDEAAATIEEYVGWTEHTPMTIIRLITLLGRRQENVLGESLFQRMVDGFIEQLERIPYMGDRLIRIYSHFPEYLHRFLNHLPERHFERLEALLARPLIDDHLSDPRRHLRELCDIHRWSSQYFHRFFVRVIANHPEYLTALPFPEQLRTISSGLLAKVDLHTDLTLKKEVLGDYYDLEFLRVGIGTLRGMDLAGTNREFTLFCDHYIRKLFDVCCEEVERESGNRAPSTDTFALLAAGGHARGQAYDDDYDLIAIAYTDDVLLLGYATKVIVRMNREILKRGVLPHHRLGDILGGFVSPVSRIVAYLDSGDEESFIDLSQLIGARMLVGSVNMQSVLQEKILAPFVVQRRREYLERMLEEILNRQCEEPSCDSGGACNIKETRGGLRDIEATMLVLKAWLGIMEPITEDAFRELETLLPELTGTLRTLHHAMDELRTVRDLYRLTVAAEDTILPSYLERIDHVRRLADPDIGAITVAGLRLTLEASAEACGTVMRYLRGQMDASGAAGA